MAKQTINVGTTPNDGTGDTVRVAFTRCNDNFTEVYSATSTNAGNISTLNSTVVKTVSNVGTGSGVYKEMASNDVKLRTIKAGTNITVSTGTDEITVSASASGESVDPIQLEALT